MGITREGHLISEKGPNSAPFHSIIKMLVAWRRLGLEVEIPALKRGFDRTKYDPPDKEKAFLCQVGKIW